MDVALATATRHPLRPTILVNSGTGLHAWWLFQEVWAFDSPKDRDRAIVLTTRFGRTMEVYAKARQFSVKGTFDISRMMRVPGTLNLCKGKTEPQPATLLEVNHV